MRDQTSVHRRRWWQFGLRGLLMLVLLFALGLLACRHYLQPYWRQKQTVALIERLGGSCQTAEVSQWWLRLAGSAQNVTQVNLADCDDPDAYVADVAELPAIELLIVGGPAFTDEHARQLHRLRTLQGLILDCTSVSDDGAASLREALSHAEVHVSQRRAISALEKVSVVIKKVRAYSALQRQVGDVWFEEAVILSGDSRMTNAHLVDIQRLSALSILDLSGANVTDAGLERLKGMSSLTNLVFRRAAHRTDAWVGRLRRALPNCKIDLM